MALNSCQRNEHDAPCHWLYFLTFTVLLGTGGLLYIPVLHSFTVGTAGEADRLVHRVAAVIFMGCPIIYLIGDPKAFLQSLRQAFVWEQDDVLWLRSAWRYYTQGRHAQGIPTQGKYNGGQKLNILVQILVFSLFVLTGLAMWFGQGVVSSSVYLLAVITHDLSVTVAVCFLLVHLYLVTIHPSTRKSITAMFEGVVTQEYAREHHAKWLEEMRHPLGTER